MLPKIIKFINNTKAIFKIDSEPTKGSNNLVTSGGVYKALESSGNSTTPPLIRLKEGWDSGSSTIIDLEDITLNTLPVLQNYYPSLDEYLFQLPSFYVLLPTTNGASVQTIFCTLRQAHNPGSGGLFIWEPNEIAPFTHIEARLGLGSPSWRWFIELPSSSESGGQTD